MGRSVMTVNDAIQIVYLVYKGEDEWEWDDFILDIQEVIQQKYKSFEPCDKWDGREEYRILENDLARIVICEYCGLVSINLAVRDDSIYWLALAEHWCRQIAKGLAELFPGRYQCIGRASNGEAFYERVSK